MIFYNLWNSQSKRRILPIRLTRDVRIFKRLRLECHFVQKWKNVFNSPKCFNYRIFKTDFALEKYTEKTELIVKSYIDLAKFRTTDRKGVVG